MISFSFYFLVCSLSLVLLEKTKLNHNCLTVVSCWEARASDNFGGGVCSWNSFDDPYGLKKFDPTATVKNFIPTVNRDLTSNQPILPYAPEITTKDKSEFFTDGDWRNDILILSHMDENKYEIDGYSTLGPIAHTFHVEEVYDQT